MIRKAFFIFVGIILLGLNAEASPAIQTVQSASGHSIWLVEDHTLPIVTVKLSFPKSGAAEDPAGKTGLASFMAQLLDEGAGDMNALAFHQALENKAIRFDVDTGQDMITVTLQTLSEHKDDAMDLMMTALTKARFDSEAVERIRASIISDLTQLEEEPMYKASRRWKELAFTSHPYHLPRRGTVESLKSISTEDLRAFLKNHFFTETKPLISVVGDITSEEVKLWDFPVNARTRPAAELADIVVPTGKSTPDVVTMSVPQTVAIISIPGLKRSDPKYPALQLLNQVLGGNSITSRLGSEVRNKRGLAYHIGTDIEVLDHAAFISASFATLNSQAMQALEIFTTVINAVRDSGITEQELSDTKNYLIGSFPLEQDTQNELAGMLIGIQYYNLGKDYLDKRSSLIQKVTLSDVNTLAKELLSVQPIIVMAGAPEGAPATSAAPKSE